MSDEAVARRLAASRLELLDLTLRNPLLNHRGSAARGVEIVDEDPRKLFAALVGEGKSLRFHATREAPKGKASASSEPGYDALQVEDVEVGTGRDNPDNSLATPYDRQELDERLHATHYHARTSLSEQGANLLFLALGFLRWRDEKSPDEERRAPLVLLPARLERRSARSWWQLAAAEEEPGVNLSLVEKLRELGIRLELPQVLEAVADLDAVYAAFAPVVEGRAGWSLDLGAATLDFFSFGKFLMYRDLDPAVWPASRKPEAHPVIAALLAEGFRERPPVSGPLDELRPPGKVVEILDADGSQAEALADVASGRNLVIQGPPGTGKSQTISNLIAEAAASGKRVLFVAEKMAALEVVHRRLRNAGLGPLCLELHSNKASKKEILAELQRTLDVGRPAPAPPSKEPLAVRRAALNAYVKALSSTVAATGMTPYRAMELLDRKAPAVELPAMAGWDAARMEKARVEVQALAAKIREIGTPCRHPFAGSKRERLLPGEERAVQEALRALKAAAEAAGAEGPAELDTAIELAELVLAAPPFEGAKLWDPSEPLDRALKAEDDRERLLQRWNSRLVPGACEAELRASREDLAAYGGTWFSRWLSPRYRRARRQVLAVCAAPLPSTPEALLETADAVVELRRLTLLRDAAAEEARPWIGGRRDWPALKGLRDWMVRAKAFCARRGVPEEAVLRKRDLAALGAEAHRASQARSTWMSAVEAVERELALGRSWTRFAEAAAFAREAERQIATLPAYVGYRAARLPEDLDPLAAAAHAGDLAPEGMEPALERAWARRVADQAFRERPELGRFDAAAQEQAVERFRAADAACFGTQRAAVAEAHWLGLPGRAGYGQVGLLRRECAKKGRHLPLRRLLQEAGAAIQAAKPVFLMSPLSVASYLPPDGPEFDLVVFDEASQVRPVDALGAVLRGKRLVVVGDERQMPPTSFFDVQGGVEEESTESATEGVQSILGLCLAQGMPVRMLRWHYRSRHESLIAVSNREFYGGALVVFPSPGSEGGLSLRHLPDTVYERGTTRTNPKEAEAVAEAVRAHVKAHPERSLGVVAFSMPQRDLIERRVEALCRKDADLDAWVNADREEPFFVKNLENVQGDERDVMLLSVGYGRDAEGQASMNFGPLNQAGGERRLNVLITRARLRCEVFSNLRAEDLDLRRAPGEGVRAFRAFLDYAADRTFEGGSEAARSGDFEEQVARALEGAGLRVAREVGSGGFRVDLAVEEGGRYVLGILTDGPRYQGAAWARDRDRLRESVLKGLGWRLHRAWSADWFRSKSEALRRCVEALKRAAPEAPAGSASTPLTRLEGTAPGWAPPGAYVKATPALPDLEPSTVASAASAVVALESPIHKDELFRRLLEGAELRAGSRRQEALEEGVGRAANVTRKGDFFWALPERPAEVRDRSGLPDASREAGMVCDEELRAALKRAAAEACGCSAEEAVVQAIRLLGVKRNEATFARLAQIARK
jgi:hypothetical protein